MFVPAYIRPAQLADLQTFHERLLYIYVEVFTTGSYAHNIGAFEADDTIDYFRSILVERAGQGFLAFRTEADIHPDDLIGLLFAMPLAHDALFKHTNPGQAEAITRYHYLAELAVDRRYQGRGVGRRLVTTYLVSLNDDLRAVFVRQTKPPRASIRSTNDWGLTNSM
jgi:GNAT superfamily N-acetyltransferase